MKSLGKQLTMMLLISSLWIISMMAFADTDNASNPLVASLDQETSLPVYDNRFVVDQKIQSLQIMISTKNIQSVKILGPAGMEVLPLQNGAGVSWQQIDNLYGITIQHPAIGQWEIKGSMLAPPKVIIDSTLKMITPDFPNNLFRGETLSISAYLTDDNQRVTSKQILDEIQFTATLHNVATLEKYKIFLEGTKSSSVFRYDYTLQTLPGVYRLVIQASGLLFQRQLEQQFYLYDYPATISTTIVPDSDELLISVTLQSNVIDEGTCRFHALFTGRDGELTSTILRKIDDKKWQLYAPISDASHKVNLLLNAYTIDKRLVNITFPEVDIFEMFQKNIMDAKTSWEEKWKMFWQENQDAQLGSLFFFSPERMRENLLFVVNQDLPKEVMPLRNYPSDAQFLLKAWEPIMNTKPQTFADKIRAQELKDKAAEQALEAKKARIEKLKKAVPPPKPSPLRQWVLGILIVFIVLFIALVGALLWVFQKRKFVSAYQAMQNMMQVIKNQAKALKARIPVKTKAMPEEATQDVQESAQAATLSPASSEQVVLAESTQETVAEKVEPPDPPAESVEEATSQAAPLPAEISKEASAQAPLSEAPNQGQQPNV
ncbi:hypothetical protein [Candidatus Berkiella aquae]|uniref:Hemicentin/VWA7 galactose-binding domain-containing protein n=1 Tax=Candidatus Berkiella aquae TaxID=295108 RepID=A0A0Q9YSN2_9GAMM|nr:hypothetical protein [Candidatus Berkiella aquae]MCS5712249.1 hypothetical protein [Candidatus Berkiella aquae]